MQSVSGRRPLGFLLKPPNLASLVNFDEHVSPHSEDEAASALVLFMAAQAGLRERRSNPLKVRARPRIPALEDDRLRELQALAGGMAAAPKILESAGGQETSVARFLLAQ